MFRLIDGNASGKPSLNGFSVNGEKCSVHDLQHGDEIIFGGVIKVSYSIRPADALAPKELREAVIGHTVLGYDEHTLLAQPERQPVDSLKR
jgi:pSer/pThr/pTyr-binding forkhead associated (FHA) protein